MNNGQTLVARNYVGGSFRDASTTFQKLSPVDGRVVATVHEADAADVDDAVRAARDACDGAWGSLAQRERSAVLAKVAALIEARFDDFVEAEIADTGRPRAAARAFDVPRTAETFRLFAGLAGAYPGQVWQTEMPGVAAINYQLRRPAGVVAAIAPWNMPMVLLAFKIAPALAVGNGVVAKPSEEAPSTAQIMAEVFDEAGLPAGAFNLVNGFGVGSAGAFLTAHPGVNRISFTGETRSGAHVMQAASAMVRPVSLELGGKNPAIVFEDADLDAAIAGTARAAFYNCGQVCLCTERVYVHRSRFAEFVAGLKQAAERLVIGGPDDPGVEMGPLISRKHRDRVLSYLDIAREDGTIVTGGGIPRFDDSRDAGAFVQPTIVTDIAETSRFVTEEVFGPVCHVAPFDDEDEAVALATGSQYGLVSVVWSGSTSRALRVAGRMRSGVVWVNGWLIRDLRTPFGGVGLSGIGKEGGYASLDFYTDQSNICVKL